MPCHRLALKRVLAYFELIEKHTNKSQWKKITKNDVAKFHPLCLFEFRVFFFSTNSISVMIIVKFHVITAIFHIFNKYLLKYFVQVFPFPIR